jgi:hypothetical protein
VGRVLFVDRRHCVSVHAITDSTDPLVELDHRTSANLDVTLFWDRRTGGVLVLVIDWAEEDDFTLVVRDAPALDVFRHPYAYVARDDRRMCQLLAVSR